MKSINEHFELVESLYSELQELSMDVNDMIPGETDKDKKAKLKQISKDIANTSMNISSSKIKAIKDKLDALK